MKKIVAVICLLTVINNIIVAQPFTHADTLRGSNGAGRDWWNATKYDLHITFNLKDSTISGVNVISFKEIKSNHPHYFQIDLQEPLVIDSVIFENKNLSFTRDGNAWFISLQVPSNLVKADAVVQYYTYKSPSALKIFYHGKPRVAVKPPWDGGVIWARDKAHNPWITIACQGLGASVWYPCKDYQGDEPDSAEMYITAPTDLIAVSNGRLRNKVDNNDSSTTTTWAVVNPINNYDFVPYIGKYVHFGEIYNGEKGPLTMDYWVLDSNLIKAKKQFTEAPRMMKAFEYWFGPYPFYEDGYKLVDAPHLGMEHQSAIAYGNHYMNGYLGRDLSGSGVGLKWDFIIVHESGHEWFGNNITSKDIADSWLHEGFTNYSETLFTEYWFGKEAATKYIVGLRKNIENKTPIISPYGVNADGPIDIYYKAANMLHTIRQVINDDVIFRNVLRGLNKTFYHQTVTSAQIENYISRKSGINFSKVFDQYLRTIKVPALEYRITNGTLSYRWTNVIPGFNMPVKIYNEQGHLQFIYPKEKFQKLKINSARLNVDENFYIDTKQIN